jgi:hypothetical protein
VSHPSRGVATAAIVCTSIGLSPLTLLCMGLLSRVYVTYLCALRTMRLTFSQQ